MGDCRIKHISRPLRDYTGHVSGKLSVVQFKGTIVERRKNRGAKSTDTFWICKCECGEYSIVRGKYLRGSTIKSCGCILGFRGKKPIQDGANNSNYKHGGKGTRLYNIWKDIRKRCTNSKHISYKWYGGKGITLDAVWDNFAQFRNWALSNGYNESLTIDRIDYNGNYSPSNCRWATTTEQSRNTSRNVSVEYKGVRMTIAEASEKSGINRGTIAGRISRNVPKELLFQPPKQSHVKL